MHPYDLEFTARFLHSQALAEARAARASNGAGSDHHEARHPRPSTLVYLSGFRHWEPEP